MSRGRSCPLDYRYRASDIAHAPLPEGLRGLETLYVVGGLYGNPEALAAVLAAFEAEPGGRRKAWCSTATSTGSTPSPTALPPCRRP
jgi:hypothetical protein